MFSSPFFNVPNKDTYPPFKNGLYMEEYFFQYYQTKGLRFDKSGRLYIPAIWTNFQIEGWFDERRNEMQESLDDWISANPCPSAGYFTVVQYDDGPKLRLPENTVVYGACSGSIPLPLIYEDREGRMLQGVSKKKFDEKSVLCSFVGSNTHYIRGMVYDILNGVAGFELYYRGGWSPVVEGDLQRFFIEKTVDSKFALAPRGYGRSSFRFFEILKLGSIPIYIWDDIEWLPYKDILDYSTICISLHVDRLGELPAILNSIDEVKYGEMLNAYEKIKHMFELEYMCQYLRGF